MRTTIRLFDLDTLDHNFSSWFPFGKIDKMKQKDRWIFITNEDGLEAMFLIPKALSERNMLEEGDAAEADIKRGSMRTRNNLVHAAHGDKEVFLLARKTRSGKIQFTDYTWSKEMGDALAWVHDKEQNSSGKDLRSAIAGKRTEFRHEADLEERRLNSEMNKNQEDITKMNMGAKELETQLEELQSKIKQAELERDRHATHAIDRLNQLRKVSRFYAGKYSKVSREIQEQENKEISAKLNAMARSASETDVSNKMKELRAALNTSAEISGKIQTKAETSASRSEQQLQEEKIKRLEAEARAANAEAAAANARVEALEAQQRSERMINASKERNSRTQADLDQLRENVAAAQVKEKTESQKKFAADLEELQRRKDELIDTERSILVRGPHPRNELRLRARIDIQERERLKVKIVGHVRDNAFAVEFPDFGRTGVVALGIDSKDENDLFMRTCLSENPKWPKVEKEVTGIGGKRREDVDVAQLFDWHDEIEEKLIATS